MGHLVSFAAAVIVEVPRPPISTDAPLPGLQLLVSPRALHLQRTQRAW